MISAIETFEKNENYIFVRAIVEDMIQIYPATLHDPPEYGPAICEANAEISEDDVIPEDEDSLIDYLNGLDLDWKMLDNYDYHFD